jgi:hypothetical protein
MSDRFFRPAYEHRPAAAMYVVADMVRLTPERLEQVRPESNMSGCSSMCGCASPRSRRRASTQPSGSKGTKLYRVGEDGASAGNPVPPQEALRR